MTVSKVNAQSKIAYILKGFPRLSESFIANEVRLLTRYGMALQPFSIKKGDELAERDGLPEVKYLPGVTSMSQTTLSIWLRENLGKFTRAQAYLCLRTPLRYLRTLSFALGCARSYRTTDRLKKTFIKEFLFATFIAREIKTNGGYRHIHAHFCHDATTVAWMVSQLTGLPFSFTAHAKDIYQKKLNPGDLLERKLAAATFVTTCTLTNVEYLADRATCPEKIHGIYHGVDIHRFHPHSASVTPRVRPVKLLSVGRHVEKKGFIYLIEACRRLHQQGVEFQLDIIGETGDQTERLMLAISRSQLSKQIRLLEPVPQSALTGFYHQADVFVLPCIVMDDGDRDGIPNVMAEAMACCLPVVVTRISGIPELIEHDVNGLLVAPKDSDALAAAIERVINDKSLSSTLGQNARKCIESRFDASKTHETLLQIFQGALGQDCVSA